MKYHLVNFTNESSAISDSVVGSYHRAGLDGGFDFWDSSVCFPSENVYIGTTAQSGFWMIIASSDSNTSLAQHSACKLAWDAEDATILGGTWTGNDIVQVYVSPTPAGSYNPWNGTGPN